MSIKTLRAFNEPMHRAVSAAALSGLAISVPGTLGFMLTGAGDPLLRAAGLGYVNFALISPATILLAPLGARIAHGPSQRRLTVLFGLFLHVAAADTPGASSRRPRISRFRCNLSIGRAIGRLAVGSPGSDASTALIEQCCKSPTESDLLQSAKMFATLPIRRSTESRRQENCRKIATDKVAMAQSQRARTAVPLA